MKREDIKPGMPVIVTSLDVNLGAPTPGIVIDDDGTDLWPIGVRCDDGLAVCDAAELEPAEPAAPAIDWQVHADRLADSLAIFVAEHPDPGTEALGALYCYRQAKAARP